MSGYEQPDTGSPDS